MLLMKWRPLIGRIVGLCYFAYGTFILYLSSTIIGRFLIEGPGGLMPAFHVSSTGGYSFETGSLIFFIMSLLLIPAGLLLVWKLKRWAAITGIIGTLLLPLTSLALQVLVSASGGPPLTVIIPMTELVFGVGFFFVLPTLGIIFAWRDLD